MNNNGVRISSLSNRV